MWQTGSLIELTDQVQIAQGATLTIEPGVRVVGHGYGVQVFGALEATGSSDGGTILEDVVLDFGNDFDNPGYISLSGAQMIGGSFLPASGSAAYGTFDVTQTLFKDVSGFYIWYPTGSSSITKSLFDNSSGLSIGVDFRREDSKLTISDNRFSALPDDMTTVNGNASVVVWVNYGEPADITLTGNTFEGTTPAIEMALGYDPASIFAEGNYFGDAGPSDARILDATDDLLRASVVDVDPVLLAPSADTPDYGDWDAGASPVIGEAGIASVAQAGPDNWTVVQFAEALEDPSVVMGPLSFNETDPATVRVRNVTDSGFEFQVDEWDYLDGSHAAESIGWLAIEAGRYELTNGSVIEAGTAFARHDPVEVGFDTSFDTAPVALAQIVTRNGVQAATTRIEDVSKAGFSVRVQEEEAADGWHAVEEIDWITVEQGGSATGGVHAMLTGNTLTDAGQVIDFNGSFQQTPALLADMQTFSGQDPATVRQTSLDASGASIFIEEEGSSDTETRHASEVVGVVGFETGAVRGNAIMLPDAIGEVRTVQITQPDPDAWTSVTFSQALDDPSVVMGPLSFNGGQPATVRVRNVTEDGFEFQVDEWDYLDGGHVTESVSFLAIEAGEYRLADGREIRAGSTLTDHSSASVSFGSTGMAPVAFSQIVTTNEASAATSRISDVSPSGFSVVVQEEEGNDNLHAVEEVDWIAISQGLGPSGFALASGDSVTHETTRFDFFGQFLDAEQRPALLAAMQTFDGADPAVLRYTALDRVGAELFVQEEQSADLEFLHTTEVVGIAALDEGLIFA